MNKIQSSCCLKSFFKSWMHRLLLTLVFFFPFRWVAERNPRYILNRPFLCKDSACFAWCVVLLFQFLLFSWRMTVTYLFTWHMVLYFWLFEFLQCLFLCLFSNFTFGCKALIFTTSLVFLCLLLHVCHFFWFGCMVLSFAQ